VPDEAHDIEQATIRRTAAELRLIARGASRTHRALRSRLTLLLAVTVLLDAVATVLMFLFEHGDPRSGFDDLGGALFWVSAQLTTVSSQMPNPVSAPGRVLDILLEVWAISAVATLAGSLAAFFHTRHIETMGSAATQPPESSPDLEHKP
jgi:hypothetical protein